jgi:hypothetical protein
MWLPTFLQRGIHFFDKRTEGFGLNNFVIFDRVHLPIIGRRAAVVEEEFAACDQPAAFTNALNFSGFSCLTVRLLRLKNREEGCLEWG